MTDNVQSMMLEILKKIQADVSGLKSDVADIKERVGKDGSRMLIVTTENIYTNQNGEVLCILRASSIRR